MRQQERRVCKASLIALDCGLGKTLAALLFIHCSNEERRQYNLTHPQARQPYRATLVVVPGPSIEVWQKEIERFFPYNIVVRQYYGSAKLVSANRVSSIIEENDLATFLDGLDPMHYRVSLPLRSRDHSGASAY